MKLNIPQLLILITALIGALTSLAQSGILNKDHTIMLLILTNFLSGILPALRDNGTSGKNGGGGGTLTSTVLMLLLSGFAVSAQTVTKLPEHQTTPGLVASPSVRAVAPDGRVQYAVLGDGLVLDTTSNPWQIKVPTQTAPTPTFSVRRLTRDPVNGSWSFPVGLVMLSVARNGLTMSPGPDYTLVGNVVTFTTAQGSLPDDIIAGLFLGATPVAHAVREADTEVSPGTEVGPGTRVVGTEVHLDKVQAKAKTGEPNSIEELAVPTPTMPALRRTVLGPGQYDTTLRTWPSNK